MATSSCLEDKWWQNWLAPSEGVRGQPEDRGYCSGVAFLRRIKSISPTYIPSLLFPRSWVFLSGSLEAVKVRNGGGTDKSCHKPREKVLCEVGKGQVTPVLEPLEFLNPCLLGGTAKGYPILSLVFLCT